VLAILCVVLAAPMACGQQAEHGGSEAASPATPAVRAEDLAQLGNAALVDWAIELAKADHPHIDAGAVRAEIRRLAERWTQLLPAEPSARDRAENFARVLFESEGFFSVSDLTSPEHLHIDSVLTERIGYCLSLSVVALAMAEELGEPLHGVAMPNHFLVRWDDGSYRRNLELTRRGAVVSDDELRRQLGDFWHEETIYGRNLSSAQVHAVLLHNRGFVASSAGRLPRALDDLTTATRWAPRLPEAHRNLGVVLGELQRWDEAIAALTTALTLYPGDVDALINLALCRHAAGDMSGAIREIQVATLLDPSRRRAHQLLQQWKAELSGGAARALDDPPPGIVAGLLGRYYAGRRFGRLTHTRVDHGLDFDWKRRRPAPGVPSDDFSVRWEGWLRAPRSGRYTLFVVSNDGVRIRFGDTLVLDHWQDSGYTSWTGTAEAKLGAGWHPLRIDYYDRSDNARFVCLISIEGDEYPLDLEQHLFHERR
jgi:regulator of sirC expression with transglutaminase-like and TPR domain